MATIDTFKQQAKYTTQTVQVNCMDGLQIYEGNFYRQPVVVNNTGKTAKTNYYISIQIKHFDLYLKYKSNYNFSDLRVYDTDGVTELEFAIQNQLSTNTLIFVKIPTLAAASKTIYLEYGNNGLNSKNLELDKPVQSATFWNFNKTKFRDWFIAQNTTRAEIPHFRTAKYVDPIDGLRIGEPNFANPNGSYLNTLPLTNIDFGILEPLAGRNWTNFRSKDNSAHITSLQSADSPVIRCNEWDPTMTINNLDTVHYSNFFSDSATKLFTNSLILTPLDEYRNFYFATVYRPTTIDNQYFFGQSSSGGKVVQITSTGKIVIVTEFLSVIAQHSATLVANTNYIIECSLTSTGGLGYSATIRINGNSETFTGTNATMISSAKWSVLGNSNAGNNALKGYLGEFVWCDGFNTSSTDDVSFRNTMYEYLNTKYRIVGSDFPTVTLGTETTLTPEITTGYLSNSTFCDVNYSQKLSKDFYGLGITDTKVSFKDNLQKVWLAGNESFDNSTLDKSGKYLSTKFSQYHVVNSIGYFTTAKIDHIFSANNIKNLANYETKDVLTGTKYLINDEDYITLDIHTDNVNVNYASSIIEFSDTNTFVNKRTCSLAGQYFTLGLNTINIKKSEFIQVNTLPWSDAIYFRIKIDMNSGSTANIYFGYGRVLKNHENLITENVKLIIGDAVSDDGFTTSYNAIKNIVTVTDVLTSQDSIELKTIGILEDFYSRKFSELPGFPTDGRPLFIGLEPSLFPAETAHFKNFVLKQLFLLAFPYSMLDFDDFDADFSSFLSMVPYFVFSGYEKVGDRIAELLDPLFSSIYFDSSTGKITFRSGKNLISQAPVKFITKGEILSYNTNTVSDIAKTNNIQVQNYNKFDSRNQIIGGRQYISTLFGFGGQFEEIGANQTKEFFFDVSANRDSNLDFLEYLRIDGFGFSSNNDPSNPALDNSGVFIRSLRFLPPSTVVIKVKNLNFGSRYFYALNLQSAYVEWGRETITEFKNIKSIHSFGESIVENKIKVSTSNFSTNMKTFWQQIVDRFGNNQRKYELEINNRKDLILKENTAFFDNKNLLVQGNIIATNENVANKKTIEMLGSLIRPTYAIPNNYLLQEDGFSFLLEEGTGSLLIEE